ncbi:ATP-binding cassette domain-containing protein [Pseudoalteromonas sp. OOF1S-7]|uniref:ATP-binding cassette domain-containing protein n=1 Tax=Pseudoalteromonas sp. OOF1S-7 TaxID=2917757 RepID=UPI001EF5F9E3|nr:ATP-binding cassette domain-containing protein [Pseudoalteromonas sp. OOF1S-7]MCG7535990.1 ATP-binding cassette domain-containing protein [Pseudoalteromonas sp. OOF1S-7]
MKIALKNISHCVADQPILANINVTVESGQCLLITGRSGSGKSVLFSIICDITRPQHGSVLIDDVEISAMTALQYARFRRDLGVIFQVSALISNLTLEENLLLPLNRHHSRLSQGEKLQKVQQICQQFGLTQYLDQRTDRLSSGLASLAGLARALIMEPKALIWDAPMAQVDRAWCRHELDLLRHLKEKGTTLVLCSNRQELMTSLTDQQLHLGLPDELTLGSEHAAQAQKCQ